MLRMMHFLVTPRWIPQGHDEEVTLDGVIPSFNLTPNATSDHNMSHGHGMPELKYLLFTTHLTLEDHHGCPTAPHFHSLCCGQTIESGHQRSGRIIRITRNDFSVHQMHQAHQGCEAAKAYQMKGSNQVKFECFGFHDQTISHCFKL